MIKLRDTQTGMDLGEITEEQLQFLIDALVEETEEDQDYYINRQTLETFEADGADAALVGLLRRALGERTDMEIAWSRT